MVNSEEFSKRIKEIMEYYGESSSSFADKIQVQRSSISHIISGRNKPSLDFILKTLKVYSEVNMYWLLNGKGTMVTNGVKSDLNNSPNLLMLLMIQILNKKKQLQIIIL